jgi:hypothetical protein
MAGAPPPPPPCPALSLSLAWPLARGVPVQRQPRWCDVVIPAVVVVRSARPCRALRCETARSTAQGISAAVAQQSMVRGFILLCSALLCAAPALYVPFRRVPTSFPARTYVGARARALDAHCAIHRTPSAAVDDGDGEIDSVDVAPRVSISLSLSLSAPGLAVVAHARCSHS